MKTSTTAPVPKRSNHKLLGPRMSREAERRAPQFVTNCEGYETVAIRPRERAPDLGVLGIAGGHAHAPDRLNRLQQIPGLPAYIGAEA